MRGKAGFSYRFPRPAVTVDACIIRVPGAGARPAADSSAAAAVAAAGAPPVPQVLLIERGGKPFLGHWALPGGFVDEHEDLNHAAKRELVEETGATGLPLAQLGAYGAPGRDPRGHTVTVAYLCVTDRDVAVKAADDAAKAEWHAVDALPDLAFDHGTIVADALDAAARAVRPGSEAFVAAAMAALCPVSIRDDAARRSALATVLAAAGVALRAKSEARPETLSE
ncbi:hypothetical protein FNF29_03831 [Cafeteria roenbergensis]|uniref:Nudix hydrolase domain-containing protein n=1 Tax=Cafeteria roenbergensis TaxID=33653 RepID=A0A5A8CJE6_CAFRO|nr:hypothetical protein FNF29_03831 [Cafeteria roenbergensis]KAA0161711.1 hypothetical protein FNF31_03654 [Cafeteria roenbergensis]KAA0165218.1 hypothetical protein FNF28_03499 [Cafeteria roenbergensis]|eukprot:KAA0152604.1 hypothetical protein FNF29_03831 [Cafeteria roenbergensis]